MTDGNSQCFHRPLTGPLHNHNDRQFVVQGDWGRVHVTPSLQWRHNDPDSVSNHQSHDCLLNRLFRHRSKKASKLRVTGLCAGNSPGTGEFPAQMASNAANVSIWWRHHVMCSDLKLRVAFATLAGRIGPLITKLTGPMLGPHIVWALEGSSGPHVTSWPPNDFATWDNTLLTPSAYVLCGCIGDFIVNDVQEAVTGTNLLVPYL